MHEASIALSIIEAAALESGRQGYSRIKSISVNIGSASGVLPNALAMAFDIVKLEGPAHDAVLRINEIPLGGSCNTCGKGFETSEQFIFACPNCGAGDFRFTTGREMEIVEIEVD